MNKADWFEVFESMAEVRKALASDDLQTITEKCYNLDFTLQSKAATAADEGGWHNELIAHIETLAAEPSSAS